MATIVTSLSWLIVAAGIVLAAGTLVVLHRPLSALHVLLDLFLAAGLLRLSADASWPTIAATAAVVMLRHIVTRGVQRADSARRHPTDAVVA